MDAHRYTWLLVAGSWKEYNTPGAGGIDGLGGFLNSKLKWSEQADHS
jgi:hypothetical protein